MSSTSIQFRYRAFDTLRAEPGSVFQGGRFFTGDGAPSPERITRQTEAQVLRWLLQTSIARELLCEELNVDQSTYAQVEIIEPILDRLRKRQPGDIDLLFIPRVSYSVAFQAKRIAVTATSAETDRSNRHGLGNLENLVVQANGMREIGFHLNYMMVIVEVDGVARDIYNFVSRGPTPERFRKIYEVTWNTPIHADVGVIFVEILQPTTATFRDAGVVGVCVDRRARPLDQPSELTAKIRQLVAERLSL
jgi:hypothetical protein